MSSFPDDLRKVARKLRLGQVLQKLVSASRIGIADRIKISRTKSSIMSMVRSFRPFEVGSSEIEVHMLLNHARVNESLWSLYSFCYFAGSPPGITVHDDGSLNGDDVAVLNKLFPGIRIISRPDADQRLNRWFQEQGLVNCRKFRDGLVFGLKLFDPHVFRRARNYILLDSDVLFFNRPTELLDTAPDQSLFSVDFGFEGSYSHRVTSEMTGLPAPAPINAGLLRLHEASISCERIEAHLKNPVFWQNAGKPVWYAEQGLYGIELHRNGARPLSGRYRLSGKIFEPEAAHSIHFCGGGIKGMRMYTHGIPWLAENLTPLSP